MDKSDAAASLFFFGHGTLWITNQDSMRVNPPHRKTVRATAPHALKAWAFAFLASAALVASPALADQTGASTWEPLGPYISASASTTAEAATESASSISAALIENASTTAAALDRATEAQKEGHAYLVITALIAIFGVLAVYKS